MESEAYDLRSQITKLAVEKKLGFKTANTMVLTKLALEKENQILSSKLAKLLSILKSIESDNL